MKNYNGNTMVIRATNRGGFQVLPENYTAVEMTRAEVFASHDEAVAFILRPMPEPIAFERRHQAAREPHMAAYSSILSQPRFREMRESIQACYNTALHAGKLAGDMQRAAVRATGQVSAIGRDISAARQGYADGLHAETSQAWAAYDSSRQEYELALQNAMVTADIPVWLFRQPVLVEDTDEGKRLRSEYEAARRDWYYPNEEGFPALHG
jgi:hypothetical protein